jgi:hypothetical protein
MALKEVRWSAAAETKDDQGSEARTCRACPLQAQHHFDQTENVQRYGRSDRIEGVVF